MTPKGHSGGHPRVPTRAPRTLPADEDHPGNTTRDMPEDDLLLEIPGPATNSKTINSLESTPRGLRRDATRDTDSLHPDAPNAPADADHPRDTTRDIPEDDLSLEIAGHATNSKTVNSLEKAPR